ncbi:MAG: PepSY domain-containing protein [Patescibacteria group bacterium]
MRVQKDRGFGLLGIFLIIMLVTGTAGYYVYSRNSQKQASDILANLSSESSESLTDPLPTDISGVVAFNEMSTKVTDKTIAQVELQFEDNKLVYRITFSDGTASYFDALTGLVLDKTATEPDAEDTDALPVGFTTSVTFADAREIAEAEMPGKTVRKIELEVEDGVVVYSVRFTDNSRVDVDATTSSVTRSRDRQDEQEDSDSANASSDDSNDVDTDEDSAEEPGDDDGADEEDDVDTDEDDDDSDEDDSNSGSDDDR